MSIERTLLRQPEAAIPQRYERIIRMRQEFLERQATGNVVVRGEELQWSQNRQGLSLSYLNPLTEGTCTREWVVFVHDIKRHSGMHRHQGGLVIFVLEGSGYTILNGEHEDWKAGDLLLLPLIPGGIEHQHFNHDESQGCKWIAFLYMPYWDLVSSEMAQVELHPDYQQNASAVSSAVLSEGALGKRLDAPDLASPASGDGATLLDRMLALRDEQRRQWQTGRKVIRLEDTSLEHNQIGPMRWYMHPLTTGACLNSLVVYTIELPPNSRTARYHYQGGSVGYILEGSGSTVING
ncbi:MAG TPA: cupin domain-containing protein, partial [Chloroflexota bacterium]|nr:cupin domain-containing protein [Chloroflexota bacterium]